jgi:glycosyltransferase involved in cell wall biosynthesis
MASVSVIIPAYNAARFLGETLTSVLSQTVPPLEVLVIDDGSTDSTPDVARAFGPRVTLIQQANTGESVARNRAIAAASGEWIAFCDADDLWVPQKLERQCAALEGRSDALWSFAWYEEFGDSDRCPDLPNIAKDLHPARPFLVPGVIILPSSAMVRRSARARFPEWTTYSEDAIYFNDLFFEGPVVFVPERLVRYRRHASSGQRRAGAARQTVRTLSRWAAAREREAPGTLGALLNSLARKVQVARWRRDWQEADELREELLAVWPPDHAVPRVLTARPWPRWIYTFYDRWQGQHGFQGDR